MTKTRTRKHSSRHSSKIHTSKARTTFHSSNPISKIIITIVLVATLIVVITTICAPLFTTESRIKSEIENMAIDYYENHLYSPDVVNSSDDLLEKYHTQGFAPIPLRNLFLYDNQKNIDARDRIVEYCDENSTFIQFYIDPPYAKTSYHYKVTYSCNF